MNFGLLTAHLKKFALCNIGINCLYVYFVVTNMPKKLAKPEIVKETVAAKTAPTPSTRTRPKSRNLRDAKVPSKSLATTGKPQTVVAKASEKVSKSEKSAPLTSQQPRESRGPIVKARPKLVRDGFTMPESDFGLIGLLKIRALTAQRHAKKSELLRAGLRALAAMDTASLIKTLDLLEVVEVGRPKKSSDGHKQ